MAQGFGELSYPLEMGVSCCSSSSTAQLRVPGGRQEPNPAQRKMWLILGAPCPSCVCRRFRWIPGGTEKVLEKEIRGDLLNQQTRLRKSCTTKNVGGWGNIQGTTWTCWYQSDSSLGHLCPLFPLDFSFLPPSATKSSSPGG